MAEQEIRSPELFILENKSTFLLAGWGGEREPTKFSEAFCKEEEGKSHPINYSQGRLRPARFLWYSLRLIKPVEVFGFFKLKGRKLWQQEITCLFVISVWLFSLVVSPLHKNRPVLSKVKCRHCILEGQPAVNICWAPLQLNYMCGSWGGGERSLVGKGEGRRQRKSHKCFSF